MSYVYVVGSWNGRFIADRVFKDEGEAITYCNECQNAKYAWSVKRAPLGGRWHEWKEIHRVEKTSS